MDKVEQALYRAEFRKFVRHDPDALVPLEGELMPLFKEHHFQMDVPQVQRRVRSLRELPLTPHPSCDYIQRFGVRGVTRHAVTGGEVIYRIPVHSFPMGSWKDHWTSTYLVLSRHAATLVDTGTHRSEESMREGFEVVRRFYGEPVSLEQVDHIIITHAHFDHFGGLGFALAASGATLHAHEWDAGTISNYPQEVANGRERIRRFLHQSGMPGEQIEIFMKMHGDPKRAFPGHPVQDAFQDGARIIEGFEVIHTPGHCPGLSCIRIGDVMLLGDQVLNHVTPHQFPKIYTSGSGLLNYMNSLIKVASRSENVRLGLPSHYGDIADIEKRCMEIMAEHHQRITDLMKDLDRPKSLYQITNDYYRYRRGREITGYEQLLALEEIGAHMEYMEETLRIVEKSPSRAPGEGSEPVLLYERRA
jgi:glyoxylase-like metal-dependent hydrolase (beta-lactamase superfamily II)